MLETAQNIPDEPSELKHLVGLLSSEVKSQALLIEKLRHQLTGLRRHRFGADRSPHGRLAGIPIFPEGAA